MRDWAKILQRGDVFSEEVDRVRYQSLLDSWQDRVSSVEDSGATLVVSERDPMATVSGWMTGWKLRMGVVLLNPGLGEAEMAAFANRYGRTRTGSIEVSRGADLAPGEVAIATGGTGGGLKLAVHTVKSLGESARSLVDVLDGRRVCAGPQLPAYHVSGLMPYVRAAVSGGEIGFGEVPAGPDRVRMVSMVGTQLYRWLRNGAPDAGSFDLLVVGGGPVSKELIQEARRWVGSVWMTYGMTETAGMVAWDPDGNGGKVMPGRRLRIRKDGEIEVGAPGRCERYLGGEACGAWMPTGDRGRWEDDRLFVEGRFWPQIVTGGEKVDPEEVRAVLREIPGVREAIVVGIPDPEWGERVGAWIVAGRGLDARETMELLRGRIAAYKLPRRVLVSDRVPRNDLGKILIESIRNKLLEEGIETARP